MLTHLLPAPLPPSRVVVLGATGFVGSAILCRLQSDGIDILPLDLPTLDLLQAGAADAVAACLRRDDTLIFTSALTPEQGRGPSTLMKNLRMAETVVQALSATPCAHLVYLSSDAVYDWRHPLISEDVAPSPTDLYSLMHIAREQMLGQTVATAKIPFCVVRPCALYGPGDTHDSYGPNRFMRTALTEGRIRLFGQGEETRDHLFIRDLVALIGLILRHRSTGVLNVVSGTSITFGDLARLIARLVGRPVSIESLPRAGEITHRAFDPTAIHRAFPHFHATPLEAGLKSTLEALAAR